VRHKKKLLLPALAGVLAVLGLSASGAMAESGTAATQLTGFHQMVVDDVGSDSYIFLSGSDGIEVTDLSGNYVATLDSGVGVAGIALSPDGGTLYAALTTGGNAGSVSAIDVSTVNSTPTQNYYSLSSGDMPYGLAFQSGELWVSYTDSSGSAGIGSLDPASGTFTAAPTDDWTTAPDLAADPQASGTTLVAVQPGTDSAAATYTTANGALASLAAQTALGQCSGETQLAVVPGGADFIVACGSSGGVEEYGTSSTSDLSAPQSSSYGTDGSDPTGAAVDADGTVSVGSSSAIYVYGSGTPALENVFNPGGSASLAAGGLAWEDSPNGSQLVAVADNGGSYSLQVFSQPTLTQSTLTLTAPSTATVGSQVTLAGSLTLSTGEPLPANTQVTITRTDPGSTTATTLPSVQPGSNGSFTLTDTLPATAGTYTYTASYGGDSSVTAASTATAQVTVGLNTTTLSLSGPSSVSIGKKVTLTGSLALGGGATIPAGTTVTVTRTGPGSTGSTSLSPVQQFGSDGSFTLTDTPTVTGAYTYTATYAGNATTAEATASHAVTVSPVATSLSITTGAMAFNYDTKIHVVAHLGATYTNRTVSIYAQWDGFRSKTLLKKGKVSSSGELTVNYTAPHSTTFSAVFTGDAHYAAKTVSHDVGIRAKTTLGMTGYYGNKKIGGTTYRMYHRSGDLYVTVAVGPSKPGECVRIEVQEHYSGAWRANELTGCAALNGSSRLYGYLTVSNGDLGYEYRVRADYVRSSSDASNLSSDSGWQYVMPER
jgi:hypothetical protein